jgi:hypothetical protein
MTRAPHSHSQPRFAELSERAAEQPRLPALAERALGAWLRSLEIGPPVSDCAGELLAMALAREGKRCSSSLRERLERHDAKGRAPLHLIAGKPTSRALSALDGFESFVAPSLNRADLGALARQEDARGSTPAQIAGERGESAVAARLLALEGHAHEPAAPSPWPWAAAGPLRASSRQARRPSAHGR